MRTGYAIVSAAATFILLAAAPGKQPAAAQSAQAETVENDGAGSVDYVFEVKAGERSSRLVIREETRDGGRTYLSRTDGLEQFYRYDGENRLVEWRFSSQGQNTAFTATRTGAGVVVRGTLKGEPVERSIEIGEEPWFQNSEYGLLPFARSALKTIDFFAVDPEDIKRVNFRARKVQGETLEWRGRKVETLRIKAHLPGPLSLVWSATYWYALPDLTFIRYQASGGGGAPRTDIRLLEVIGP
jgi:hypothetical protein